MKITEKQLVIMLRVLEGTLTMYDRNDMNLFGYDRKIRLEVYNQIINQQSDVLVDVKGEEKIENNIVADSVFNKAVEHAQETYSTVYLDEPYMLLGDVAELIKITTGKEIDWNVLAKYSK